MDIKKEGLHLIKSINIPHNSIYSSMKEKLETTPFEFNSNIEEIQAWFVCILALRAAFLGNFGVGAAIFDNNNMIIEFAENQVVRPFFRSDGHAEMLLLSKLETKQNTKLDLSCCTLVTSLESCPMCLSRIIIAQVGQVVHVANDIEGGMVHKISSLPSTWVNLQKTITFRQSTCSVRLKKMAEDIFLSNAETLNAYLIEN
jgi:cytosine deaminase